MSDQISTDISLTNDLSPNEKISILTEIFPNHKKQYIDNIGDYLYSNFSKLDGFNYQWNSLITSTPLLFEDVDYLRCRQFINNTITEKEIEAYKKGELRELYATFENLLICNLSYYDRIMSFCTMVFLHYIRINEDDITKQNLEKIPYMLDMTPTQIWCCTMCNTKSTEWELNYGWGIKSKSLVKDLDTSVLEFNWKLLYKLPTFGKFVEYSAIRTNTSGFRQIMIEDKTPNKKLGQVCAKFTRTSTAISELELNSLY
jgi:hypothetical protein